MRRALGLIATVGVLAAVAAACGDDRPSREALADQVTKICQAAGERHVDAANGFDFESFDPTTSDLSEIVPLIEQNVAIGREAATELDKVRGPKADEDTIDRWIEVNAQIAENADEMIDAARQGDSERFMALGATEEELHAESPGDRMLEGC